MSDTAPMATALDTSEAASLISDLITDDLTIGDQTAGSKADHSAEIETLPPAVRRKLEIDKAREGNDEAASEETQTEDEAALKVAADEANEEDDKSEQDGEDADTASKGNEVFTVKVDGKEIEVPKDEVIAGYQRQADYSRKTQTLAEERKAFDEVRTTHTAEAQSVAQERGQYKAMLGQLQAALDNLVPKEPDWNELYQRDPQEFLLVRDQWKTIQEQKSAAKAEVDRVSQLEAAERGKAQQARAGNGRAKLVEWNPKWSDEKVLRDDFTKTVDYAKKTLGYTDAELAQADDHRALFAVHKARLYDELMAKAKGVREQATKGSKKVLAAGSANRTSQTVQTRSQQDGMKRLVKGGGRVEDAASLIENMMDL